MPAGPFRRRRNGVDVTLTEPEVSLLRAVAAQLESVLEAPEQVPHAYRLFPPAYRDDPDAQAEYARLTASDLADGKRAAVRSLIATLDRGSSKRDAWRVGLSEDESQDWLAVLNDARLTLGTRLAITEESYIREPDPSDPEADALHIYHYLGYLEEYLVETLMP